MKAKGLLIFILFIISYRIYSQYLDMKFIDPFTDINLSNKSINCITQDTMGYIWIGTKNGLNRFNGYDVKIYQHNYIDTNTLLSYDVRKLYVDSKGRLWIGANNGLCLYNPLTDNFIRYAHPDDSCGLNSFDITCINEDKNKNLYVANALGIYILDELSQTFKNVYMLEKGEVLSFLFDKENNLWIGTYKEGGLIKINDRDKKVIKYFHDPNNPNSLTNNSPVNIALQNDKLWIATYGGGINCLDIKTNQFKHYLSNSTYEKYTSFVYVDKDNRVWEVDFTSLKIYDKQTDSFIGYYSNADDPYSIKYVAIGIFQDKQKNYWTYHANDGVCLRIVPKGFKYFDNSPERFWYTGYKSISAINNDQEGNLWLGNPSNGINIFRWSKSEIEIHVHDPNKKYSLGPGAVHTIFRSNNNTMWVGTHMGGLQYYKPETKQFYSYLNDPNDRTSIANNDIRSITEDNEGNLWLVTHGKGIDKFDLNTKKFYHFNKSNSNLSNDYAFHALMDRKENLWVSTVWGLSILKKGTKKFINFYHYPDSLNSLTSNEINSVYEDEKGQIWICTAKGLNLFNPIDSNFIRFDKGFVNTNIGSVLTDRNGKIWAGTDDGISMLDISTHKVMNFDQSDGLFTSKILARSSYRDSDYTLYFGGVNGINVFNPHNLVFNTEPPKVIFSKLKLFNKEILPDGENSVLKQDISHTKQLKLKYDQKVITFEFTALNFINPHKNKYKYKLENFDKDWIDAGYDREVTYTNLNPGKYIFKVIASNNDDVWNMDGASLNIIITPPWWKTILFRLFLIILIISLFIIFFFYRTAQLRRQKSNLEKQVKERTMELLDKNNLLEKQAKDLGNFNALLEERQQHIEEQTEELKSQAEKLSITIKELEQANSTKNKLFSIIAHDLKDPFNTILGFADYLAKEFKIIDEDEKMKMVSAIMTSSKKVHTLLDNLLKWARSQTDNININKKEINVFKLVQNSYYILKENIASKNQEIIFDIPDKLNIYADEDTILIVIRNLINNAIKFTPENGTITIKAQRKNNYINIYITDTGIGMSKDVINHIFKPDKNKTQLGTDGEKGSGLGLLICKEFIDLNQGTITVTSEPQKGSTFCIALPAFISD